MNSGRLMNWFQMPIRTVINCPPAESPSVPSGPPGGGGGGGSCGLDGAANAGAPTTAKMSIATSAKTQKFLDLVIECTPFLFGLMYVSSRFLCWSLRGQTLEANANEVPRVL